MASGAKLNKCVMDIYNQMKVVKSDDNERKRIRLVSLKIQGDVDVEETFTQEDVDKMEGKDVFQFLTGLMKGKLNKSCRYFLYDCHYDTAEASNKQDLVFILWAPGDAPIKDKMHYACSKSCLSKIMDGFKHRFEITDIADISKDSFLKELGKSICSLEGHACDGSDRDDHRHDHHGDHHDDHHGDHHHGQHGDHHHGQHGDHHHDHAAATKCSK